MPRILLELLFVEYRNTKAKVIVLTSHRTRRQSYGPIGTQSKYMQPAPSAVKRVQASHDWLWFHFLFVNKVAQEKAIAADLLSTLSYKLLHLLNFVDLG